MTVTHGFNTKNRSKIKYIYTRKVVPAVLIPTNCGEADNSAVEIEDKEDVDMEISGEESEESSASDEEQEKRNEMPQKFTQEELSDLGRELGLSKEAHELLASRLKQKNLLEKGTKISVYRNREQELRPFFTQDKSQELVYCNNIAGLMNSLKAGVYKPEE